MKITDRIIEAFLDFLGWLVIAPIVITVIEIRILYNYLQGWFFKKVNGFIYKSSTARSRKH